MSILLVEDDRKAASLLVRGLHEEGYAVDVAFSAAEAEQCLSNTIYLLLILDWFLPDKSGLSLCQQLRGQNMQTPILMLTARDAIQDRVAGLNAGADDYLTKPFAFAELLARTQALLRRAERLKPATLSIADLLLNPQSHQVSRAGHLLDLTQQEEQTQIFERFYRGTISRTRDISGVGLGLALSQAIIRSHGGRIEVAENIGGGSVFSIRLPSLNQDYVSCSQKNPLS